jgi:hypothetical protein
MTLITRETYNAILEGESAKRRAEAPPRGLAEGQEIIVEGRAANRQAETEVGEPRRQRRLKVITADPEPAWFNVDEAEAARCGEVAGAYCNIADVLVEDLEDLFVAGVNKLPKVKRRGRVKNQSKTWNRLFAYLCAAWTKGCRIGTMYLTRAKTGRLVLQIPLRWHISEENFKELARILHTTEAEAAPEVAAFMAEAEGRGGHNETSDGKR